MSPYQHGEVFVTDDGAETEDLDLGHYERFTSGRPATKADNVTTGRVYQDIITRERRGDYLGATIEVCSHVTNAIKDFILDSNDDFDFMLLCGDQQRCRCIEGLPFFEAIRRVKNDLPRDHAIYHSPDALAAFIPSAGELKTKPTQHSVKELRSIGIQPDILLCRTDRPIPKEERLKARPVLQCALKALLSRRATSTKYLRRAGGLIMPPSLDDAEMLAGIRYRRQRFRRACKAGTLSTSGSGIRKARVTIAIVGKYTGMKGCAYKSLIEALSPGGIANKVKVSLDWIESEVFENEDPAPFLEHVNGILVPGGFGTAWRRGEKFCWRSSAREAQRFKYFGICFGMQMAVIEAARNLVGIAEADFTEFGGLQEPVVGLMSGMAARQ